MHSTYHHSKPKMIVNVKFGVVGTNQLIDPEIFVSNMGMKCIVGECIPSRKADFSFLKFLKVINKTNEVLC